MKLIQIQKRMNPNKWYNQLKLDGRVFKVHKEDTKHYAIKWENKLHTILKKDCDVVEATDVDILPTESLIDKQS